MSKSFSGWQDRYAEAERYSCNDDSYGIISDRKYNLVLGATVFYGLAVNALLCATVGAKLYYSINPIIFLIGYVICAFGGIWLSRSSTNPAVSFLGYNLIVLPIGLVVSACVQSYGGIDSRVVLVAFYYTMLITAIMVLASILFPGFFANIGGVLFAGLIGIVLCSILSIFIPAMSNMVSLVAAAIFALYIGFDYYRAQRCLKTVDNAIDCAVDIYLDIANLFLRILEIVGNKDSRR